MKKNVKILFTISILANVLLAGALGGMAFDHPNELPWQRIKEDLTPESQKMVTKMFQDTWKDMSPVIRQSMDNRKYLADVIAADDFSPKKFDEAVGRIRGVQTLIVDKKVSSTKELLGKLPLEDRKKLAEPVADSLTWKGGRGGKKPPMHDCPKPPEKPEAPKAE